MINFQRNNLNKSNSPYLQQHKDNPIFWQEWSKEVIDYAIKNNKLIFVSVGYSTCHWCHVMASDAFMNHEVADFLNQYFVCIKIDREQRPDIDHYMMSFITETQGSGGWPLNVVLTPSLKPFSAFTFVSAQPKFSMPSFINVLKDVKNFYDENKKNIQDYKLISQDTKNVDEAKIISLIDSQFDDVYGGFGFNQKFPPHNTLLFLLHYFEKTKDKVVKEIIEKTLDIIALKGLNDHLQGGFFRYCVDREWKIPHFEKMLYDQTMLLWIYSFAYKIFKKEEYKLVAEKIVLCLEQTFEEDGVFYSAHDADTDHEEGATYLWSKAELQTILSKDEFEQFCEVYEVSDLGNFNGMNHLIKKKFTLSSDIESKLLNVRKQREQPFIDKKILTDWNALLGVAFVIFYRCLKNKDFLIKSEKLFETLIKEHFIDGILYHSSFNKVVQKNSFLSDYTSMLLLATYLFEENIKYKSWVDLFYNNLQDFKKDVWYENINSDFKIIPASFFDHPIPSSVSLAEMVTLRKKVLCKEDYQVVYCRDPLVCDFFNVVALLSKK